MFPRRAAFTRTGFLALHRKAWGTTYNEEPARSAPFLEVGPVAVVDIAGPLLAHSDRWGFFDSYEAIEARARAAFESSCTRVLLRIDSPGGDAQGCFELSRELRAMSARTGKELVTLVRGTCASAAYAIGCAATRVVAPPTASVGSIGVYEALLDLTEQDAKMGVKVRFVASGTRKLDGNPHVPLSDEARDAAQEKVELLSGLFFELVAAQRGLEAAAVERLEGALLLAGQALASGLITDVMSERELLEELQSSPTRESPMTVKTTSIPEKKPPQAKCSDKEWEAIRTMAESDDEDMKKAAKKCFNKAVGEKDEVDEEQKKKDEDAKAKAEKDEEAKAATAEEEKKKEEAKAQALAANSLQMAKDLAAANARIAAIEAEAKAKAEAAERDSLFAKRPDFTEPQRKLLASLPIEKLREAVETWPRVAADPQAAAASLTAGGAVQGGERAKDTFLPQLTAEQQAYLDKIDGKRPPEAKAATSSGTEFAMPRFLTQAEAKKRLDELEKGAP
jgi:capsid assembly protease